MRTNYEVQNSLIETILIDLKWMFDEFDVYACIYENNNEIYKRDFTFYRGVEYNYQKITFSTDDKSRRFYLVFEVPNTNQEDIHLWLLINRIIETIFVNTDDAVFFKGTDLRYKYVNQVFRRIHNAGGICLVNMHHCDIFGPKYIFPIEKETYVLNTERPTEAIMNFSTKYRKISYEESIEPLFDNNGQLYAICSIARNLQIQKNPDIEPVIKRDLKEILNDLGVYYFESKGEFDYRLMLIDDMFKDLGYEEVEIQTLKQTMFHYVHEEDLENFVTHYIKNMANPVGDNSYTQDMRVRARDGSYRWFRYFEKKLYLEEPDFIAGSYIDIHDVMISKEQAIKNAKEKAMFLASMSHEIRTPLNAILGFSELLEQMELGDKQQEYTVKIKNSTITLIELINNVLDFSKIEAGKLEAELIPFNLHESLHNIHSMMEAKALEKGIQLKLKIAPEVDRELVGDELRIIQIITNLCSNAIKFTQDGYVKLQVNKKENNIHFSVIDTGIGMNKIKIENIFNDFTQAEKSTSRRYGGTGLGLSISKQLAKLLGGEINVESTLGKGSIFTFKCPIYKIMNKEINKPVLDIKTLENTYKGSKLLLVEDVPDNQQVVVDTLSPLGFEIVPANNGLEAVQILKTHDNFNLVIMDLQMPVMDGFEATKEIRHFYTTDQLPIIALTADASLSTLRRTVEYDMQAYLLKPIRAKTLIQSIVKHLPESNIIVNTNTGDGKVEDQLEKLSETLNVDDALERFGNNKELLLYLVQDFANLYDKIPVDFISDKEEIRFFHNLKGVSGNLGATRVQDIAGEIEMGIISNNDMNHLRSELCLILKEISSKIKGIVSEPIIVNSKKKVNTSNISSFEEYIEILKESLSGHYLDADELLIGYKTELVPIIGIENYSSVLRSISDYRFPDALAKLEEVLDG